MLVEALVAEATVEALDIGVLDRAARLNEVQFDAVLVRPEVESSASEFRTVVDHDEFGCSPLRQQPIEDADDTLPRKRAVDLHGEAFAAALIDDIESPESPRTRQRVAH